MYFQGHGASGTNSRRTYDPHTRRLPHGLLVEGSIASHREPVRAFGRDHSQVVVPRTLTPLLVAFESQAAREEVEGPLGTTARRRQPPVLVVWHVGGSCRHRV